MTLLTTESESVMAVRISFCRFMYCYPLLYYWVVAFLLVLHLKRLGSFSGDQTGYITESGPRVRKTNLPPAIPIDESSPENILSINHCVSATPGKGYTNLFFLIYKKKYSLMLLNSLSSKSIYYYYTLRPWKLVRKQKTL